MRLVKFLSFLIAFNILLSLASENFFIHESFSLNPLNKPIFKLVSASGIKGCCEKVSGGGVCQLAEKDQCSGKFLPTNCSEASFCQKGCCYNEETGEFSKNTIKSLCSGKNQKWYNNPSCEIPQTQKGCCYLGKNPNQYTTLRKCEIYTKNLRAGTSANWTTKVSEEDCLQQFQKSNGLGACKINNHCTISMKQECASLKGIFYEGYLCTSKLVNSTCKPTQRTKCVQGRDQVFFEDSCGNMANIYDYSRINDSIYWEKILPPSQSCGFNNPNGNQNSKTCGNCNRFLGGICSPARSFKPSAGSNYCRPTTCSFNNRTYKNGESWCFYDTLAGNGKDAVGSRHWLYRCDYGKVIVEPCEDYRNEVCFQQINNTQTHARCLKNKANTCLMYNLDKKTGLKDCLKDPYCMVKKINIDSKVFNFEVCVPRIPHGFILKSNTTEIMQKQEKNCKIASQTCTILKVKKHAFRGRTTIGKNCGKEVFAQEMNSFCASLGDCGADINYKGIYTENYQVSNSPKLSPDWINSTIISKLHSSNQNIINFSSQKYDAARGFLQIKKSSHAGGYWKSVYDNAQSFSHFFVDVLPRGYLLTDMFRVFFDVVLKVIGNLFFSFYMLFKRPKKIKVHFECEPWEPPPTGKYCDLCNKNPLRPCSPYQCHSLGAPCDIVNPGTAHEKCVDMNPHDITPPSIKPLNQNGSEFSYSNITQRGFFASLNQGDGCVQIGRISQISVQTDEEARCRASFVPTNFDNMTIHSSNYYSKNHTFHFSMPDPSPGVERKDSWRGSSHLYVGCSDTHNNQNRNLYTIQFCVKKLKDIWPPKIKEFYPKNHAKVGFEANQTQVVLYTDELAQCKWSYTDLPYEQMNNSMVCNDVFGQPSSLKGYVCEANLPLKGNKTNTFYFRCKDKPWEENESKRFANQKSKVYVLERPATKIRIDKIKPDTTFKTHTEYTPVDIEVYTSGGADRHVCSISTSPDKNYITMLKTGSPGLHTQPDFYFPAGKNKIYVSCKDETGDTAKAVGSFEIIYDKRAPMVVRIYRSGDAISFETDEMADCRYSEENCLFSWSNGTSTGLGYTHKISSSPGKTYYIKCRDQIQNIPLGCSVIIKPV